jgi:hypothetical protein
MIHANETNEKRKRYEISVNLNDPGSVVLRIILKNLMILFILNEEKYFVIISITEVFSVHVHVYQLLVSEKGAIVIMI